MFDDGLSCGIGREWSIGLPLVFGLLLAGLLLAGLLAGLLAFVLLVGTTLAREIQLLGPMRWGEVALLA